MTAAHFPSSHGGIPKFINLYWGYPLVMTNIAMVKPWPIEIDGLPGFTVLKNGGSFHGYVKSPDGTSFIFNVLA